MTTTEAIVLLSFLNNNSAEFEAWLERHNYTEDMAVVIKDSLEAIIYGE